jgi:hypothetical protein
MKDDFKPVATLLAFVAIILIVAMMLSYVTHIQSDKGFVTVTVMVGQRVVGVKSICLPGCERPTVPARGVER